MSWLTQRPNTGDPTNFYTVGHNKNILIVGLGNPGKEYDFTRHNVGFYSLDVFIENSPEMQDWILKKDLKCQISLGQMGENRIIAIKPTTYMNLSGQAVQAVANFYKVNNQQIVVIQDELDIDFGYIRMRRGGSNAGHNGIKSISGAIGEDYARIRIGIGPKRPEQMSNEDFVLQKFSKAEKDQLHNLSKEVIAILNEYIYGTELPHDTRKFLI